MLYAFFWVNPRRDPKQIVETAFTHAQGKETATYDTIVILPSPAPPPSSYLPYTSGLNVAGETFTFCFCSLTPPVLMAQTISKPNLFPYNTPTLPSD